MKGKTMWGIVGAAAMAVAGAAANAFSSHKTNQANKSIAAQNNATSIELANTAHQREVKDLQEAGLNPILSANNGATTPQLASAHLEAPQIDINGIASAINAMTEYEKGKSYSENLDANTRKTDIEARLAPEIAKAQIKLSNAQGDLAKQRQIKEELESEINEIQKEYYEKTGTAPNMSHLEREAKALYHIGKKGGQNAYELLKDFQNGNIKYDLNKRPYFEYWDYKKQKYMRRY